MNIRDYKFKVGDEVVTTLGETGKICGICTCERCAERGYFEPMWVRDDEPYCDSSFTEYISVYQAENGFNNFYRIGKYRFNDFDKDHLTGQITSYEEVLTRLKKQLANIEAVEKGEDVQINKTINKTAEWWVNDDGGVYCSNCGLFYDDYFESAPDICERCGSIMSSKTKMMVERDYRLSSDDFDHYLDESEYPEWLLKLRREYVKVEEE